MRKYLFLAGMLALTTTFTACSSDDEAAPSTDQGFTSYMSVAIASANGDTRTTDTDFDVTTAAENTVSTVNFYYFDKDGKYVTSGSAQSFTDGYTDQTAGSVARIYKAVVALKTSDVSKTKTITQMLAVANGSITLAANATIADAKKAVFDSYLGGNDFIMASSVYGGNENGVTSVKESDFYFNDESAAKASPVDVYVERLASKVQVKLGDAFKAEVSDQFVDGESTEISVSIVKCALNALETKEYAFKNISSYASSSTDYFTDWNDATNYRCYWAEDPKYTGVTYLKGGYLDSDNAANILDYLTEKEVAADGIVPTTTYQALYCTENTYGDSFSDYLQASTSLLVLAQIKVGNDAEDLIRLNGTLYTLDNYKNAVLKLNAAAVEGFGVQNGNDYVLNADYLTVPDNVGTLRDGKVACQLDASYTYYKKGADDTWKEATAEEIAAVNTAFLSESSQGDGFKQGMMYYSVPIKHLVNRTTTEDGTFAEPAVVGEYGVVRNHIYSIELDGITGLGHAVWSFDEHIVPVDKETNYYLGARLNVQAWRIVPVQKVVF